MSERYHWMTKEPIRTSVGDRPLNTLSAAEIADGIRGGRFGAEDVVRSCLARIAERDGEIAAWVEVDGERALRQARNLIAVRQQPLAGVPFAVKDVIETVHTHTRMGSAIYEHHRARFDAGCVAQARMAGGIMLGKTTTCEFAGTEPTRTANPHDTGHTPGGSSSGSAAAVADFMVPFAFGTQTGGSVLRPASFCGVVGFKPTYGFYTIAGVKLAAHSFDTVGVITRSVGDVALVHSVLMDMQPHASAARESPPTIGVFRSHLWNTVGPDAAEGFDRTVDQLAASGARIIDVETPPGFQDITRHRAVVNSFERARGLAGEWSRDRNGLAMKTAQICERGFSVSGEDYVAARRGVERFRASAAGLFADVDLLLTPATPGEAPAGKNDTGDPRLQELWTMLHLPSLALPAFQGRNGLPVGIQLVGPRFDDSALLASAGWIEARLQRV
jgi:Asp-tRNA(Asn)/Glu-tRNA(Gln) amidotransferase A subunit family amidase